jgi:hypothetical protein
MSAKVGMPSWSMLRNMLEFVLYTINRHARLLLVLYSNLYILNFSNYTSGDIKDSSKNSPPLVSKSTMYRQSMKRAFQTQYNSITSTTPTNIQDSQNVISKIGARIPEWSSYFFVTVEPAYKDVFWTSDLTRIIEALIKKT